MKNNSEPMIKNARINIQELQDAKLLIEILVKTLLNMLIEDSGLYRFRICYTPPFKRIETKII
ncbi:hypothetical protein C3943_20650 [Lysinibacillus sp. B2A1]|nr:hypothetical protein C3943_20650 [Lysinibacillus sp. B2A1]